MTSVPNKSKFKTKAEMYPLLAQGIVAPTTGATVQNGGTVSVANSAGADAHNATAAVSGTTLTNVKLAATVAMVDNNDTVATQNSAGTVVGAASTLVVAAGVVTAVKTPATTGLVTNGQVITATGAGTTATLTVTNGVVSIALS